MRLTEYFLLCNAAMDSCILCSLSLFFSLPPSLPLSLPPSLPPSLSLSPQVFESLQMQSDEERDLHTTLSRPHMQKLMSVHDIVRSRSYETPVPQFDPTWHPQTNYDRHVKRGKGKTPEYRTVGLHKSANEPLVSCWSVGRWSYHHRTLWQGWR